MPKLEIEESNKLEHKWWHNVVPNKNVSYETHKEKDKWVTMFTCHWCSYTKIVTKWWNK